LIAGSYPALFLSKFNPAQTIKNDFMINKKFSFRQVSTIVQFTFSVFLILGTLTVYKQIDFMKNSDIGIHKENVVLLSLHQNPQESKSNYEIFKNELQKNSDVLGFTGAYTLPGINSRFSISIKKQDGDNSKSSKVQLIPADYDFIKTLELKLVNGRDFSKEMSTDAGESIIINETAVKSLNLNNPIGSKLIMYGSKIVTVIGVVKDFHVYSFQKKIDPCIISINPDSYFTYAIKINDKNIAQTISSIKDVWNKIFAGQVFEYKFMSDAYKALYSSEEKIQNVLSVFTLLAVIISCIGLMGFTSYVAVKKTKEIGVRKVFGAGIYNIIVLFSRQFVIWIIAACIIAIPVAFYVTNKWLENFAYRISMDITIIIISIMFTLLVALSAIGYRAIKAATANPIKALRYE
jgi:putative ABC transport system permease protein